LEETPVSNDQKITIRAGLHTLTATVPDSWQLHFWIRSQGAAITVLKPASLRESIIAATGGKIDLFADPRIRLLAAYGIRIPMQEGVVPPFADCRAGSRIDAGLNSYCARVLGLADGSGASTAMHEQRRLAACFMGETPAAQGRMAMDEAPLLRSFFDRTGVLVCRPGRAGKDRLAASIKAGGNGSHSHNDIGSYVIALGDAVMAGDPGGPFAYDNKTFGPQRYTHRLLNSFGHPVPVVADALQRDATKVKPKVLETVFTAGRDTMRIDLASAYDVPDLKSLVRTLVFDRSGAGAVAVHDAVRFAAPRLFEIGLPTRAKCRQTGPRTLELELDGRRLTIDVATPEGFTLTREQIEEFGAPAFTRLGIRLVKPVVAADVTLTFRPAAGR